MIIYYYNGICSPLRGHIKDADRAIYSIHTGQYAYFAVVTKDSLKKKDFKHQVFQRTCSLCLQPLATVFRQQDCISQQELANENVVSIVTVRHSNDIAIDREAIMDCLLKLQYQIEKPCRATKQISHASCGVYGKSTSA